MSNAGHPPKLTPKIQERICSLVRAGNFRETACAAAGIASRTLRVWLRKAREAEVKAEKGERLTPADTRHLEFGEALERAEAECEARDIMLIGAAAKEDWKAAAWRVERRGAKRWGFKQKLEHSGPEGGPISIDARASVLQKLKALADDSE